MSAEIIPNVLSINSLPYLSYKLNKFSLLPVVVSTYCWVLWMSDNVHLDNMPVMRHLTWFFLCWDFTAQSTQWGHVERSQFT